MATDGAEIQSLALADDPGLQDGPVDKRERAARFRERLHLALEQQHISRTALARRVGVDRSTIAQLLASDLPRLPNGQVIAELAAALRVSSDWLLGLVNAPGLLSEILDESLHITDTPRSPADANLYRWYQESLGSKIRHVPQSLPDMLKTDAVVRHEFREEVSKTTEQAVMDTRGKLAYARMPDTDVEICMAVQILDDFAKGGSYWAALDAATRREQLDFMVTLLRELYPRMRLYLFDLHSHYSAPVTVFGRSRAAIYVGQKYLVFSTTKHVRAMSDHFDELIRAAVVQADQVADYIAEKV